MNDKTFRLDTTLRHYPVMHLAIERYGWNESYQGVWLMVPVDHKEIADDGEVCQSKVLFALAITDDLNAQYSTRKTHKEMTLNRPALTIDPPCDYEYNQLEKAA